MYLKFIAIISVCILTGCATNNTNQVENNFVSPPPQDKAQVVFMRFSSVGAASKASLYDVTDGSLEPLGIIYDKEKLIYLVKPGKRIFMVFSEAADFMEADLLPGKTYYSIATARFGGWDSRFSLWPIKTDSRADYYIGSAKVQNWIKKTKLVDSGEEAIAFYKRFQEEIDLKYEKNWQKWKTITKGDLVRRTLSPEDGS